jgi:hypothetical protein
MGAVFLDSVARAQEPTGFVLHHAPAFSGSTRVAPGRAADAQNGGDPIDAHLLREATRHAKVLLGRDSSLTPHAAVTGMATNLRLHAAHVRATNVEPRLADALKRRTRGRNRDTFLDSALRPDAQQRHHDQLTALGIEDLHVNDREIPREHYDRMITTLSTPGALAGMLDQAADDIDAISTRIVVRGFGGSPHAVKVQDIAGWCSTMTTVCQFMREAVAIICALSAAGFPEFAPVCAVMGVEAATACFLAWACGG